MRKRKHHNYTYPRSGFSRCFDKDTNLSCLGDKIWSGTTITTHGGTSSITTQSIFSCFSRFIAFKYSVLNRRDARNDGQSWNFNTRTCSMIGTIRR